MNQRIGEYPVPFPSTDAMLPENNPAQGGRPAREHIDQLAHEATPVCKPIGWEAVALYRQDGLDVTAHEHAMPSVEVMPTESEDAIRLWILNALDKNDMHPQPVLDLISDRAEEAGMTIGAFEKLARDAIAHIAHGRGRI